MSTDGFEGMRAHADGVEIDLKISPGARGSEVVGPHGDRLKLRIAAPPEAGRANKAICALLAQHFNVRACDITITRGATHPLKTVLIRTLTLPQAQHLQNK